MIKITVELECPDGSDSGTLHEVLKALVALESLPTENLAVKKAWVSNNEGVEKTDPHKTDVSYVINEIRMNS